MRRHLLWLIALAGIAWLYFRRGGRRPEPVVNVSQQYDPAEELRRKLDETKERGAEPAAEDAQAGGPEAVSAAEQPIVSEELEARRREVHDRARSAADEMRRSSSD